MKKVLFLALAVLVLASCGNNGKKGKGDFVMDGTWQGTLPCADCSGIEYILTLQPEGFYKLTVIYLDAEGDGIDDKLYADGKVVRTSKDDSFYLRLLPAPGNDTVHFKVIDANTLRLVKYNLQEPQNGQLYDIVKQQ